MGKSEFLKRPFGMGLSFLDMTRERAEALVKEMVDQGVVRKGQAEKAAEQLLERSKQRTEALAGVIRREVTSQLSAFGVATKDDIARLEAKLDAAARATKATATTKASSVTKGRRTARQPAAAPADTPPTEPAAAAPPPAEAPRAEPSEGG